MRRGIKQNEAACAVEFTGKGVVFGGWITAQADEVRLPRQPMQTTMDKVLTLAAKTSPAAIDAMSAVAERECFPICDGCCY